MSEVNYEAAIQKLKFYSSPILGTNELIEVFEALRSPVEQKTCEHNFTGVGSSNVKAGYCKKCGVTFSTFEKEQCVTHDTDKTCYVCRPKQECEHDYYEYCSCHSCATLRANRPKQEDLSLAGKLEHRCRVHLSVETTNKLKDCCIYDLLAHEAESHYAPIIEASYHEGYSMGQKNACPKDLGKAKEEAYVIGLRYSPGKKELEKAKEEGRKEVYAEIRKIVNKYEA